MGAGADYNQCTFVGRCTSSPELMVGRKTNRDYTFWRLHVRHVSDRFRDLHLYCFAVDDLAKLIVRHVRKNLRILVAGELLAHIHKPTNGKPPHLEYDLYVSAMRILGESNSNPPHQLWAIGPEERPDEALKDPGDMQLTPPQEDDRGGV